MVYGLNRYNKNVELETSLSDIYADIAVGAPFDGDGKVFIYRGSKSGIETKPAQVSLDMSDCKENIKGPNQKERMTERDDMDKSGCSSSH